ncbi:AraC family transcriptional regulator [Caulobacter sp. HMWF009]|nr:AraC family transcriptional regulator [Caulobacter sp. HMWF009]PTT05606.1 AraC family transcriptional regulator [Caulobacter sp. HMWF025]
MDAVSLTAKIIWYVEAHLDQDLTLNRIARGVGAGPFHVARVFALTCAMPVMAYVRARRLSLAARLLRPETDILSVAVSAGYGSHEAFSRAFRAQFGISPKTFRQTQDLTTLRLMEPLTMTASHTLPVQAPRMEKAPAMTFGGLNASYRLANLAGIPGQWQKFRTWQGQIEAQTGEASYGISHNFAGEDRFDYMCAVEIGGGELPEGFTRLRIAAHTYAVFTHEGHVSGIGNTWHHIYDSWLPAAGLKPGNAASFERMDDRFDSRTGSGVIEIWVPVA